MSRYTLCPTEEYPDPFIFEIEDFKYTDQPVKYLLTQVDVIRFDLCVARFYGDNQYEDIVLFLNSIAHRDDLVAGTTIIFPIKADIESFLYDHRKST